MGVKIDLLINDLEEATFLDKILLRAADHFQGLSELRFATPAEREQATKERELALRLRNRTLGGS